MTEVNSNYANVAGRETSPDSLLGALWWADVQGRLLQQRVDLVAHFALADAGGLGMLDSLEPRSIYAVFVLYAQLRGELVESTATPASLRVYAARRSDGELAVLVVNTAPVALPAEVELRWPGADERRLTTWLLDATHRDLQPSSPERVLNRFSHLVPPRSVYLLRLA